MLQQNKFDILIIGSGIAGLSQAISLSEKNKNLSIGVISKAELEETNTRLAQGGIAAVMSTDGEDSYSSHIEDTIRASQNVANLKTVEHIVEHAHLGINQLEKWGVEFDKVDNKYHFGLEGGHSFPRVLHVKDQTGAAVHKELVKQVKSIPSIQLIENTEVLELILNQEKEIGGAVAYNSQKKDLTILQAKIIILATGGMGQLFEYTTNSSIATGDGILLAHNVGAKISNIQAIQFHPTAFKEEGKNRLFLITEALRGAGAYIVNDKGNRFVFNHDERGELATRDVVSKAIYYELKINKAKEVYIDARHLSKEIFDDEFPFIYNYCKEKGYDLTQDLLPIAPAAHYSCGGIEVTIDGKTSVPHLYAIGECANTGLHGNNRLASNSLLEAIVLSSDVTKSVATEIDNISHKELETPSITEIDTEGEIDLTEDEALQLRKLLSNYFISNEGQALYEIKQYLTVYISYIRSVKDFSIAKHHFMNRLLLSKMLIDDRAGVKVRVEL